MLATAKLRVTHLGAGAPAGSLDLAPQNSYVHVVDISFDPAKRDATLQDRGLDFADAADVFAGEIVFEAEDDRRDYAEIRIVTVGFLRGRMIVIVWTPRGSGRRVVSMRKANDREQARFGK